MHSTKRTSRTRILAANPIRLAFAEGLSCYTAALATCIDALEVGTEGSLSVLGNFCYLGVQVGGDGTTRVRHNPQTYRELLADHGLQMTDSRSDDVNCLRSALTSTSPVIICGDASRLPWSPYFGATQYRPHWFSVLPDPTHERVYLVDAFEAVTDSGEQRSFAQPVSVRHATALARVMGTRNDTHRWRNLAQGVADAGELASFEWVVVSRTSRRECPPVDVYERWSRSPCQLSETRSGIAGVAAFQHLAEILSRPLSIEDMLDLAEEAWVAARQRSLLLFQLRSRVDVPPIRQWCEQFEERVARPWHTIPQLIRVNVGRLRRNRPPSSKMYDALMAIKDIEARMIEHLRDVLVEYTTRQTTTKEDEA